MRMKFKGGFLPEQVAEIFLEEIRKNKVAIGDINIYIRAADGDDGGSMGLEEEEYWEYENEEKNKDLYDTYIANMRRAKIRKVV